MGWQPTGGGSSPLTTKGDIHGFSTVDARLPVGSDGQVLTADSAQSLGIKWAAAGGGSGSQIKISENRLASPAAYLEFSSIPGSGTYPGGLLLIARLKTTDTTDASTVGIENVRMRVGNGSLDTGSNYDYRYEREGSFPQAISANNVAYLLLTDTANNSHATRNSAYDFGFLSMRIPDHGATDKYPLFMWHGWVYASGTANFGSHTEAGGAWESAAGIDVLRLYPDIAANFATGSVATLYGLA